MQIELREIHEDVEETFVHVTHDQDEAFTLADRIGIMNGGRLIQVGDPDEVYESPKNRFIEGFLGDTNFITGEVTNVSDNSIVVDTALGTEFTIPTEREPQLNSGDTLTLSLRPEILSIVPPTVEQPILADGSAPNKVYGTVESVIYRGSTVRYSVTSGDASIFVERRVTGNGSLDSGDDIGIEWDGHDVLAFYPNGSRVDL